MVHTPHVELEPCFQEVVKKEAPPDFKRTPETQRAGYTTESLDPQWIKRLPPVLEERLTIPNRNGNGTIDLTINRPLGTENEILPVIVYIHGGGWVVGDESTHRRPRTQLAVDTHAAVVFVHYSRSPEHRYPVALEECYDTVVWVASNAVSIRVDPAKLVIAGDSAGGNLTIAVTLLAKQRGLSAIRAQVLFYPVTDSNFNTDSYNAFATGYDLTRELMIWFWDHYVPEEKDRQQITVSPLKACLEDLQGLPPALVISCEADVLRDEAEAYARKLLAAGVQVSAVRILGTIHGFLDMPFYDSHAARLGMDQAIAAIRKVWDK
ncbi:putative lipase [Fennellomyces sp. T-0311]|nr:putative lipase [Fennellomyces sp. T-0311]